MFFFTSKHLCICIFLLVRPNQYEVLTNFQFTSKIPPVTLVFLYIKIFTLTIRCLYPKKSHNQKSDNFLYHVSKKYETMTNKKTFFSHLDVCTIHLHCPFVRIIEPLDKLDAGGLAATRWSHQGNCFTLQKSRKFA